MAERITIIQFVEKYTRQYAGNTFLWEKQGKEWVPTTFEQTRKEAYRVGAGLMALGAVLLAAACMAALRALKNQNT